MSGSSCTGCTNGVTGACNRMYPSQTQQINIPGGGAFNPATSMVLQFPFCTAKGCDNLNLDDNNFFFSALCLSQPSTSFYNIIGLNGLDGTLPQGVPPQPSPARFTVQIINITPSHVTVRIRWNGAGSIPAGFTPALPAILCLEYWATCPSGDIPGCCPDPQLVTP